MLFRTITGSEALVSDLQVIGSVKTVHNNILRVTYAETGILTLKIREDPLPRGQHALQTE